MSWKNDLMLNSDMDTYVLQGMKRKEMLDYLKRDFSDYAWSMSSLDRRLRYFDISYTDKEATVDTVLQAVAEELDGPGSLLGYRAMHKQIRIQHNLKVPRDVIYAAMRKLDPEGLRGRSVIEKKKKKKGCFFSSGPNWVHAVDGHDKLMGYQNHTFPLAVYGCIDTCSRKLLWLKVWTSNSDPSLIGRWYMEYLVEHKMMPTYLRMDRGTETGVMSTIHAYLHSHHVMDVCPEDTVLYGPSTSNQIERWWKELHHRLELYFKEHLSYLKEQGFYNPSDQMDRSILAFVMIPVLQKEMDNFLCMWNTHRIRQQKNTVLPNGIPNHIYDFPAEYGLKDCGWAITDDQLEETAYNSGVLDVCDDYLDQGFRQRCVELIPATENIKPSECSKAYEFLKKYLKE